ncbi:MAG: hypothetical protein KC996_07625 [Phycisphaerales bacterium]|nr:hypothetical protein [Phycisphaerales bacterium]
MPGKRASILSVLALAFVLCGCRNARRPAQDAADWVTLGAPAPISSNATRGLEVQMWIMDNTDSAVQRVLAPYDTVSGVLDERDRLHWGDWGLRWCVVPIGEVKGVLAGLSPVQPARVQWLGEFGDWRPIVRAGTINAQTVRVGEGESGIPLGKPRLIARSWIEPIVTDLGIRPGVRADLALQIEQPRSARSLWEIGNDDLPMIDDDGPVVDGLITGFHADGLHAFILVADVPGRDWSALPEPIDDSQAPNPLDDSIGPSADADGSAGSIEEDQEPDASTTRSGGEQRGPGRGEFRSLGELMFTTQGSGSKRFGGVYDPPRSVVVVLIPRTEGGFGLIPSSDAPETKEPQ